MDITPQVGAALISGVGSLLGNLFGLGSNQSTNKTNLEIARQNNAMQYKMFNEANQFTRQMWNDTNEYNSAEQQRARLQRAGLNPNLMMNGGSAGTATSQSSASTPSLSTPTMQPFMPDMSGINQAAQILFQKSKQEAEINNLNSVTAGNVLANRFADETFDFRKKNEKYMAENTSFTYYLRNKYERQVYEANLASMEQQRRLNSAQETLTMLKANEQSLLNDFIIPEKQAQLAIMAEQISNLIAQRKLTFIQGRELLSREALNYANSDMTRSQTELLNNTMDSLITTAQWNASNAYWQSRDTKFRAIKSSWDAKYSNKELYPDNWRQNIWSFGPNSFKSKLFYGIDAATKSFTPIHIGL